VTNQQISTKRKLLYLSSIQAQETKPHKIK
jgi:hypothetical protein